MKVIILLNLVYYIYNIIKKVKLGLITIYTDNKRLARAVNKKETKVSEYVLEGSVAIAEIKRLIN